MSAPQKIAAPEFDAAFRDRLRDLLIWRRDVRRFRREPLPKGAVDRLLALACLAPSVGLSQPWRFVTVCDPARRAAIGAEFARCNEAALACQNTDRAVQYARLKLAGLDAAPQHVAVFAVREPEQGHGLGRRTMPETSAYSAVAAIHTLWLAARAEGIGVGWVSILDPARVAVVLDIPADWLFIGYLCLGYPEVEDLAPELEREGWESRRPPAAFVIQR